MAQVLSGPQHEVLMILAGCYKPLTHESIRLRRRVPESATSVLRTLETRGLVHNAVPTGGRWFDGLVSITGAGADALLADAERRVG